jgi:protein involved in polysaccharide export with SLBB domain
MGKAAAFKYYIWGSVRRPGIHLLGPETDMTELLSSAGGPTEDATLSKVDIIRGIDRRIERLNLKEIFESGENVGLVPGDVVIVHRAFWSKFRQNVALLSSIATLINLAFWISYRARL